MNITFQTHTLEVWGQNPFKASPPPSPPLLSGIQIRHHKTRTLLYCIISESMREDKTTYFSHTMNN